MRIDQPAVRVMLVHHAGLSPVHWATMNEPDNKSNIQSRNPELMSGGNAQRITLPIEATCTTSLRAGGVGNTRR